MKKQILSGITFYMLTFGFAQEGVGVNTQNPDESALLDVVSEDKGFLPPRVQLQGLADVSTITEPATGLVVYNTGSNQACLQPALHFYNGSRWIPTLPLPDVPEPGATVVANIVRDPAGYGGFSGATPPTGMVVQLINSIVLLGLIEDPFDGNLLGSDPGNTYHNERNGTTTEDWGTAYIFDRRFRFTQVDLNGRSTSASQGTRNRLVNVVVQVWLCGEEVWESAPITGNVSADSNIVNIPDIIGNEIRIVIPDGGDTGGDGGNVINYDELIISGES